MTFQEAVECYRCLLCKGLLDELKNVCDAYTQWRNKPTSQNLTEFAKVCVVGAHQHRILNSSKQKAIEVLEKNLPLIITTQFADFEELYDKVKTLIGNIPKIGLLTVYDVTLRIGHILNKPIYPKKYLYLNNSGAMEGATKLLDGRKLQYKELFTNFFSYPEALSVNGINYLQALPNCLVEDFLCVMHKYLDKGSKGLIADRWKTSTYKQIP